MKERTTQAVARDLIGSKVRAKAGGQNRHPRRQKDANPRMFQAMAAIILKRASSAGVPALMLGKTGGQELTLPGESPISLERLKKAHEDWLPSYMAGEI